MPLNSQGHFGTRPQHLALVGVISNGETIGCDKGLM